MREHFRFIFQNQIKRHKYTSIMLIFFILFLIGILGIVVHRKNILTLLMSIELLLLAINLIFI
jgi:NADH-quinone oxidoreductase subunit K